MSINLRVPKLTDLKPRLTVVGVGGAGGNAVNNMIAAGLTGVQFVVANTDAQALAASSTDRRIQLGLNLTEGLGAGSKPEIGQAAAEEAIDDIRSHLEGAHMVFIAAGMGGGTGTGAAAVLARTAQELGILTVGIVTKPFQFEGARRMRLAEQGISELRKHVDTLIVIPNQNLFRITNERTTFSEAFVLADQVLFSGIACIVDLIVKEGLINLDFADVRTIMSGMGSAMMGTGEASGEGRAVAAAEEAISNPLLDDVSLKGAKGLLLSIIGGRDLTLYEVDEAASRIRQEVDPDANIIVGASFDDTMDDRLRVAIVASGMTRAAEVAAMGAHSARQAAAGPSHPDELTTRPYPAAPYSTLPPLRSADSGARSRPPLPGSGRTHGISPGSDHARPMDVTPTRPATQPGLDAGTPAAGAARTQWMGPGDVLIEENAPGDAGHTSAPQHGLPAVRAAFAANHRESSSVQSIEFTPAPPNEIRRARPRMPEVEEFPMVGQREYRTRVTGAAPSSGATRVTDSAPQPPSEAPKPGSLLQRLVGAGRRLR